MDLKEKRLEAIKELILPYWKGERRRSVFEGRCKYNHPEGHHCAFAEACTQEGREKLVEGTTATNIITYNTESILRPQYRGLFSELEWNVVQRLHDRMPTLYDEMINQCQPIFPILSHFDKQLELEGELVDILKAEEANFWRNDD